MCRRNGDLRLVRSTNQGRFRLRRDTITRHFHARVVRSARLELVKPIFCGEQRIDINLKKILRGKAADVALRPDDQIVLQAVFKQAQVQRSEVRVSWLRLVSVVRTRRTATHAPVIPPDVR